MDSLYRSDADTEHELWGVLHPDCLPRAKDDGGAREETGHLGSPDYDEKQDRPAQILLEALKLSSSDLDRILQALKDIDNP